MTNGFYNSNDLPAKDKRKLLKDAIDLAYNVVCQSKYGTPIHEFDEDNWRKTDPRLSIKESINYLMKDKGAKLHSVDRYQYNQGQLGKHLCEYEICFHTTSGPNDGWLLLYIYLNETNFNQLMKKYNLTLIELGK